MAEGWLDRPDGARLRLREWAPAGPKAVVQIAHGLAEHAGRYARFAAALNGAGYAVLAHDHRGHGETAPSEAALGHFADRDGWSLALADLDAVRADALRRWPGLPVFLFGHSMGSFMAQDAMAAAGQAYAGVVLSGSNGTAPPLAGRLFARAERWRLGRRGRSRILHAQAFGAFNARIPDPRTAFDWLSRDPAEVDAYIADPRCGFVATVQLWIDLLDALARLAGAPHRRRVPDGLPVLFVTGRADPVSAGSRGIDPLVAGLGAAGLSDLTDLRYEGARHELLNETNRDAVTAQIIAWLDARAAA